MTVLVIGWAVTAALAVGLGLRLRRRGRLVARACHEVRGPLTAAGLALHAARRPGGVAAIAAAEGELRRAAALLDDLRGAGRGARPIDRVVDVDVRALVAEQVRGWRSVAAGAGTELQLAPDADRGRGARDAVVRADPRRLRQATGNLLANAIEHGCGPVSVAVRADGDRVRIDVADAGAGGARVRGARGGRGHGLSVVADVASRHGGRLALVPGTSRVGIELPRTRSRT